MLQQYEDREENTVAYLILVREVTGKLKGLSITHIPREENAQVDWLARPASSSKTDLQGTQVEYVSQPIVFNPDRIEVDSIDVEPSWMDPIQRYLTTGSLPTYKFDTLCIRYRLAKYHIINGILYKRGCTLLYLQCMHPTQVKDILEVM